MNITLKEMISYAESNNLDVNKIYDLWNKDKAQCIRLYKQTAGNPSRDLELELTRSMSAAIDPDDTINDLHQDDFAVLRLILQSLDHKISFKQDEKCLWAMVTIVSTFSDHIEEEHMIFNEGVTADDEGVQNAVESCISQMKYEYLNNF